MVSYPITTDMKHTSQVILLTEVFVSVTTNCRHSGHCVLHGLVGSFSKSRITVGAVKKSRNSLLFFQSTISFLIENSEYTLLATTSTYCH